MQSMLTFLRKIRKSLIESGSARKYLLYAIGEIALVVIGILIALQINNWNEWRKEKKEETVVLNTLANTLQANIEYFDHFIEATNWFDKSGLLIDYLLRSKSLASDTLYRHFHLSLISGSENLRISEIGYKYLENTNGKIIRNVELRNEIIGLFESNYTYALQQLQWGKNDIPEIDQFIDLHFERTPGAALIPYEPQELYRSRKYNSLLKKARAQRLYFISNIEYTKKETQRILQLIKDELGDEYTDKRPSGPLNQ